MKAPEIPSPGTQERSGRCKDADVEHVGRLLCVSGELLRCYLVNSTYLEDRVGWRPQMRLCRWVSDVLDCI